MFSVNINAQDCPDSCEVFIPNNITADCDDVDCAILTIQTNCVLRDFEFSLYNRWGEIVFNSEDPKMRFDTATVDDAVYFWTLKAMTCNNDEIDRKGNIYVLK